ATIEVEKVEVNGRTFMRLIASGDQPPELKRLGQSLFVNDEALLAAAASAYIQVHVLGEDIQQQALNELLAHSKPVGYIVHREDDTQFYPLPAGYPKLEVSEVSGEVIVFHGQKLNPHDIAFVENLNKPLGTELASSLTRQVKKYKVKSYQHVIRSRQMAVLEDFVTRHDAAVNRDQETLAGKNKPETLSLEEEDKLAILSLAYYESLHQALASATPDEADEFEFTPEHIKIASSVTTPTWLHIQLAKHFNFRPVLRDLLNTRHFVQNMLNTAPHISKLPGDFCYNDEHFADKVLRDLARQLIEVDNTLEDLQIKEAKLLQLENQLQQAMERVDAIDKEKQQTQRHYEQAEFELGHLRYDIEELENQERKLQKKIKQIPKLKQQLRDARIEIINTYNSELAIALGIDDWDDAQPQEEQSRRLLETINDMRTKVVATYTATGQSDEEVVKAKLAAIEGQFSITPDDKNDLSYSNPRSGLNLDETLMMAEENPSESLALIERHYGLVPVDKADLNARIKAIQEHLKHVNYFKQLEEQADQPPVQQQSIGTETEKAAATRAHNAVIGSHLNLPDFEDNTDPDTQQEVLFNWIESMNAEIQKINKSER
ncbi:hypothetical protein, partial [Endozoicomonas sp. SESOKO3]|uniref:hypothetical protein n=1 Tax=Endozoicomonas sp. SESOKO3 TaxID=2828744 RepID=UPI00214822CC